MSDIRTLSIIIPVLNEGSQVVEALQQFQPYRDAGHELILVDGGSQDNTVELASQFVDRLVRAEPGRAIQMRSGAHVATGDLLWFVHIDTQLPGALLGQLFSAVDTRPSAEVWGRFDVRISGTHRLLPVIAWMMNQRSRLTHVCTGDQGMFVSRLLYRKAGGFKPLALMEDIEFSKRLRRISTPLCLAGPLITSGRRWEKKGIYRTIALMWFLRLSYLLGVSPQRLAGWYYPREN